MKHFVLLHKTSSACRRGQGLMTFSLSCYSSRLLLKYFIKLLRPFIKQKLNCLEILNESFLKMWKVHDAAPGWSGCKKGNKACHLPSVLKVGVESLPLFELQKRAYLFFFCAILIEIRACFCKSRQK